MGLGFEISVDVVVELSLSFGVCFGGKVAAEAGRFKTRWDRRRTRVQLPSQSSEFLMATRPVWLSPCLAGMIMGAAGSTVYYNLKLRHPTLDLPIIDYDLVLLIQPMLMLGISIGVAFNVAFADWMVTVLLIFLFIVTSTKAFLKGVEAWKKETIMKKEAAKRLEINGSGGAEGEYKPLPGGPNNGTDHKDSKEQEVSILENVYWKELGLLVFVWVAFLAIQITKNYTATCSTTYWALNLLQIPVSFGVSLYEAVGLYKGHRVIASQGDDRTKWRVHQLVIYCFLGVVAGIVGGLLGLGGGFIMGPLFLELGIPPQVSSASATFGMTSLHQCL
ncbi:hypothetical protein I3842_08G024000 [Carya illinoinensis]|uniref:Sulfite exporter TauE/SafE family protein n=1 Tax=Carya illinoinensis TaxID=32201 RepID=A0A922E7Y3_CARIL|nr:hypothetical protein I3842_08G024000 [Carya illinoinensis]